MKRDNLKVTNLCCVVNSFVFCEVCTRRWCEDCWYKDIVSHDLTKGSWSGFIERVCGRKKVQMVGNGAPYTLVKSK